MEQKSPILSAAGRETERLRINAETARIEWRELQRFFAQGHAIFVAEDLDLVEVALEMQCDNPQQIQRWMTDALVGPVSDAQAQEWIQENELMWCVVVRPWVLVQPVKSTARGTA